MLLYKTGSEVSQYILENFPFRFDFGFPLYINASEWIDKETTWVSLVERFTYASDNSILYELRKDADYARWMLRGTGLPTLFFRDEKHAIWFKLNWDGAKDDGE
jgi:hypothetical protein